MVVGDFLFWLVIFFGLVLSLKLQIELAKGFIFEVSSQSLKRREAENGEFIQSDVPSKKRIATRIAYLSGRLLSHFFIAAVRSIEILP